MNGLPYRRVKNAGQQKSRKQRPQELCDDIAIANGALILPIDHSATVTAGFRCPPETRMVEVTAIDSANPYAIAIPSNPRALPPVN
jgi:hypothetical protein